VEGEIAKPFGAVAARRSATVTGHGHGGEPGEPDAAHAVTALYEDHALALIRLAYIMLGAPWAPPAATSLTSSSPKPSSCRCWAAWPEPPSA
jgi:hypothetical protein